MTTIKLETGILASIFRDIPSYFNRGSDAVPGLTIAYNGATAYASIAQRQLSVVVTAVVQYPTGGYGEQPGGEDPYGEQPGGEEPGGGASLDGGSGDSGGTSGGYGEQPLGEHPSGEQSGGGEPPVIVEPGDIIVAPLLLDLRGKTLAEIVAEINTYSGYSAALVGETGEVPAIALVPIQGFDLFFEPTLSYFTSTLWCLLMALVYALEDTGEQVERGARQLYLDTAEGKWVDNWGIYYTHLLRRMAEEDRLYAQRIVREVVRWKLNGVALEQIIEEETGLLARVTNLYQQAWEVGGRLGRLAGRKYVRSTFEVLVNGLSDVVVGLINKYKAAGTLPFFRYQLVQGDTAEEEELTIVQKISVFEDIRDKYAWVLGRDRCGELRIGGKECTIIDQWVLAPVQENYLTTRGSEAVGLVLGTGALGISSLGNALAFGILFSEGAQAIV